MAFTARHVAFDPADDRPAPRRYAWSVFAVLFALMVVDYIDRQVVVSMFSHLKAQWDLSDSQLGALVSIVSITVALGAVPLSLLADRWSRVKSVFLMALVWSLATIACAFAASYGQLLGARALVGVGEAAYGTVGAALLASLFPARMRSTVLGAFLAAGMLGSVLGVVLGGFIARTMGLAGGLRRGRHSGSGAVRRVPAGRARLQDRGAARQRHTGRRRRLPPVPWSPSCSGRARRSSPASAPGLNLLVVSTTWAWLPSYLNRYLRPRAGSGGPQDRHRGAGRRAGRAGLEQRVADRLSAAHPSARLIVPAVAAVLTTVIMCVAFAGVRRATRNSLLIVAGGFVMAGSVGPTDAVVIDVIHPGLRATGCVGPVANPKSVRSRRWTAARRRAVRCVRIAVRDDGRAVIRPGCGGHVHAGGADLRKRPQALGGVEPA